MFTAAENVMLLIVLLHKKTSGHSVFFGRLCFIILYTIFIQPHAKEGKEVERNQQYSPHHPHQPCWVPCTPLFPPSESSSCWACPSVHSVRVKNTFTNSVMHHNSLHEPVHCVVQVTSAHYQSTLTVIWKFYNFSMELINGQCSVSSSLNPLFLQKTHLIVVEDSILCHEVASLPGIPECSFLAA